MSKIIFHNYMQSVLSHENFYHESGNSNIDQCCPNSTSEDMLMEDCCSLTHY
jgi:hypothetical protein